MTFRRSSYMAAVKRRRGVGFPPISFATIASAAAGNPTVTIPTGFGAGDLCLVFNFGYSADPALPTDVTPAGFTSLIHQLTLIGSSQFRSRISAKILTGAEGSLTGIDGGVIERWISVLLRPSRPIAAFSVHSVNSTLVTTDPPAQTIAAAAAVSLPVVLFGHMGTSSAPVDPRIISPAMEERQGSATNFYAHWKSYSEDPLDHSYNMDDEGNNILQSGYLRFTPA